MNKKVFLSLLALSVSLAQAEQVYDITLTSGESYTNCTITEKTDAGTQFTGTDKEGKQISKTVAASDIASMNEPGKDAAKEEESDGQERAGDEKAADATLRLRAKLAQMDEALAKITKPTRSLVSQTSNVKKRITSQLEDMDARALQINKLQQQFNLSGAADYTFDKVSIDDRDRYERDGKAAYKAMLIDTKQKKGSRKIGGLDKFEIMSERYQGIPEYKSAHKRYIKTLKDLDKKWSGMLARETAARKRLNDTKKRAMTELDRRQLEETMDKLKESGEDINRVWVNPPAKNLLMLNNGIRKVQDVFRRTDRVKLDPAVGTVPSLIKQFWADMDKVRELMITGNLEAAEDEHRKNAAYNLIMALKREFLPNEYRNPIREQYRDMQQEITKRKREYDRLKAALVRETSALERITTSAEAQINNAMQAVQRELDSDIGENTMETDTPEQPAEQPQPAAEAAPAGQPQPAETPAEEAPAEQPSDQQPQPAA